MTCQPFASPDAAATQTPSGDWVTALEDVYARVDAQVASAGPVCQVSGRCCRFAEYGHTLFLSQPEADYLLAHAPAPARPLDDGQTCPWQDDAGRCTARSARPVGCRVYFCDPGYQETAAAISESAIVELKALCQCFDKPWHYAPLHSHLAGRLPPHQAPQSAGRPLPP